MNTRLITKLIFIFFCFTIPLFANPEKLLTDAQLTKIKEMHKLSPWAYGTAGLYSILKASDESDRPAYFIIKTEDLNKTLEENLCELRFFKGQKLPEETDSSFEEDKFDCAEDLHSTLQHYHIDMDTGHVNEVYFPKDKNEKFYKSAYLNEKGETIYYVYRYENEKHEEVRREYDYGLKGIFKGLITEKIYFDPTKKSGNNLCITLIEEDTNKNGIFDKWSIYENCKEVLREYDKIENGTRKQITVKFHYDPAKKSGNNLCITLMEEDTNKNGIFDIWTIFENCVKVRKEYDENENGTKESIVYYKNDEWHSRFEIGAENREKAETSVEQGNFAEAIAFYQASNKELIQEWGFNTREVCKNITGIGNALYVLKSVELIEHTRALLAIAECRSEHERAAELLGWYYIEKDDYDAAINILESEGNKYSRDNETNSTRIHRALGRAFYMKKEYQKVITILEPAIQIYKKTHTEYCLNEKDCNYLDFMSYVIYLNSYEKLKNYSKVHDIIREIEPLLKGMPSDARAQFAVLVGYGYLLNKNTAKAGHFLKLSLDTKFFDAWQYFYYACALLMADKQKTAEAFFEKSKQGGLKVEDMIEAFELLKTVYPNKSTQINAAKRNLI